MNKTRKSTAEKRYIRRRFDRQAPRYLRPKQKLHLALLLLGGAALIALELVLLSRWEDSYYENQTLSESISSWQLYHRSLEYDGQTWRERQGLESYLLIGVDTTGTMEGKKATEGAGQADTLMLLVIDNKNETWRILQLNRDSMVEIPVLGLNGEVVKTRTAQLALAYAYGDGQETSCRNTVDAVSALLEDQKITGSLAVNIDSIALITDLLGGVTVTLPADYSFLREGWTQGARVELDGEDAELMVRQRYDIGDRTNLTRMERQLAFWEPFSQKLLALDEAGLQQLLDAMQGKMVTDISTGTITRLRNKLVSYTELGILTIQGENHLEGESWAYDLDYDSRMQTVITLFFQKRGQ